MTSALTTRLVATVAIVCLGALQFGYHMAELNSPEAVLSCRVPRPGPTPYLQSWFGRHGFARCIPMLPQEVGTVTLVFLLGGLLGSFFVGGVAERHGRRRTALWHCVVFAVGLLLNGVANLFGALLAGRFVAGVGAGAALATGPVFINEVAPLALKGLLGSMNQVSVNLGILLTQCLALAWCDDNHWRLLLLAGAAVAALNFGLVWAFVDESPMWLANRGFAGRAYRGLHRLRGGDYAAVRREVDLWGAGGDAGDAGDAGDGNGGDGADGADGGDGADGAARGARGAVLLRQYLQRPEYANSRLVSTGILIAQQFCGINSIIFYGVLVLLSVFPDYAVGINCLILGVNVVVTFGSAPLIDHWGRKPLLMGSVAVMSVAATLMGVGIIYSSAALCIVGTFLYIIAFAMGLGPIPFLLVAEITQPNVKAVAQSWGTACNWFATGVVGLVFPVLKNSWLGGGVYFIFTGFCVATFVFVKRVVPETKGTSTYEEVWRR